MMRVAFLLLFGLAACGSADTAADELRPMPIDGWQMASGKAPTKAEFGAVLASCQDRTKSRAGNLDSCLSDLGLKRAP